MRTAKLIPGQQHWRAVREQQRGEEITLLPLPGSDNIRILCRPFLSVVIRPVIVMPVVIVFTIVGIMLFVVRHQVIQRKAVVGGDKVDAGPRTASAQIVQVTGTEQARGEVVRHVIALPVLTYGIAVFVVPLPPAWREAADLITTGADIPGLTNQLQTG